VEQHVIDAIKFNRGVADLAEKDATIIRFGRDLFRQHKVSSLSGRRGMVELLNADQRPPNISGPWPIRNP
jgi:hypothetical protein